MIKSSEEQQVDYVREGDYFEYMSSDSDVSQDAEMEDQSHEMSQKSQVFNFSVGQSAFSIYKSESAQTEKLFSDEDEVIKGIAEQIRTEFNKMMLFQYNNLVT